MKRLVASLAFAAIGLASCRSYAQGLRELDTQAAIRFNQSNQIHAVSWSCPTLYSAYLTLNGPLMNFTKPRKAARAFQAALREQHCIRTQGPLYIIDPVRLVYVTNQWYGATYFSSQVMDQNHQLLNAVWVIDDYE